MPSADGEGEATVQPQLCDAAHAREIVVMRELLDPDGALALPHASRQSFAARESLRLCGTLECLEVVVGELRGVPERQRAQRVPGGLHQPERAQVPAEILADSRENPRCGLL